MGKWTGIKDDFPKYQTFDEKVKQARQEYAELSKMELVEKFREKKNLKEALEDNISELNTALEAIGGLVCDLMESTGESSFKCKDGTFFLKDEPYSAVEDMELFKKWIIENKMEDILRPQWQTTNAIVKDRLERGENVPPGINVFIKTTLGARKA